jgi:hypothetical protein
MKEKIILDLCGGTGAWSKPYKDKGYDVRVITLPDDDVLTYKPPKNVHGILAAPPCTQFSIARNDTTAIKPRDMREGMKTIEACLRIIWECLYEPYRIKDNKLKFWALENPYSGYLKRFLGKPSYVFNPHDFGDPYTKKTALWGMFNEPKKTPVDPEKSCQFRTDVRKGSGTLYAYEETSDTRRIQRKNRSFIPNNSKKYYSRRFCTSIL